MIKPNSNLTFSVKKDQLFNKIDSRLKERLNKLPLSFQKTNILFKETLTKQKADTLGILSAKISKQIKNHLIK
jgi:hypothetical protein